MFKKDQLLKALGDCKPWSLSDFHREYKRGRLQVDEYQRNYQDRKTKWNSLLVDSILCNISIGEIMVERKDFEDGDYCYYVIDGQHRIMTLMRYMDGDVKIQGRHLSVEEGKKYNGSFSDLIPTYQNDFEMTTINVYQFTQNDAWTAAKVFLRMNDGGQGLKPMQKYHAKNYLQSNYRELYDFAHKPEWLDYCKKGYSVKEDHLTNIQALFKHLQYYHQFINGKSTFKNGEDFKFDDVVLSKLSSKELKQMLDSARQYIDLYDAVAGHGIEILSGNDPRKTIFVTIILNHLLSEHNISNLSANSIVIAEWLSDFMQKESQINTSLVSIKIAGRGDSIDVPTYVKMVGDACEELEDHLYSEGMPQVHAPITKKATPKTP